MTYVSFGFALDRLALMNCMVLLWCLQGLRGLVVNREGGNAALFSLSGPVVSVPWVFLSR